MYILWGKWKTDRKYIVINGLTACIFHYGRHTCGKRQKTGRLFMLVPEAISTDPRMIQSQVQFSKLYIAVLKLIRQRKNWRDIEKKVKLVLSKKVTSYEKITQRKYIQPLKTGFDAVKKYKKFTDQKDQLYVLMINESQQIVFMTSSVKMKLAKKMSSESENSLSSKFCFFDGKFKRTKGFTTLAASIYDPFLKRQIPLAVMECTKEDERNITRFWKKFNRAYKIANNTNARFQPAGWVTDMELANFNGLKILHGEEILHQMKGYEFRYKQSVNRTAHFVGR